jgi:hypothetical protein
MKENIDIVGLSWKKKNEGLGFVASNRFLLYFLPVGY